MKPCANEGSTISKHREEVLQCAIVRGSAGYRPVRETAYEIIRDAITWGIVSPGERLSYQRLGETIGVSRSTIRHIVKQLESEGYVTVVPRDGTYVRPLGEQPIDTCVRVRTTSNICR